MYSTKLTNAIKSIALVFAVAFGFILMSSTDASAQGRWTGGDRRDNDRYERRDRNNDQDARYNGRDRNGNQSIRFAFQRGYQQGLQAGRQAARSNRGGYGNNGGYYGNNRGWGNNSNSQWQRAFQEGYQRGYREGYSRASNRNNRNSGYYPY